MFQSLKQLQEIYNASCQTKATKITIERTTFEQIKEQIKTKLSITASESTSVADSLQRIRPD